MATQEFYIRGATETEARGPFNQEQLTSLAEAGQVNAETLYYEATTEQWVTVGSNNDLMAMLFPEKKKLGIKARVEVKSLNVQKEDARPIEVTDMLAAAEGRSPDTRDKADPTEALMRNAKIGMWACTLFLIASAAALLLPSIDALAAGDYLPLLKRPFVLFGVVDVVLFLLLLLHMVSIYPLVRFRAALGLGFLGLYFWTQGQMTPFFAVIAGYAAIYLSTIFTNLVALSITILLGLVGLGGFVQYMLTH